MTVGLVIPAHGRLAVSRLAFTGYAWLIGELAVRGITATAVVVADDENLDLAREFGFDTLERPNVLGEKVNAGFEYMDGGGAEWVCFTGSDNWLHPDLFNMIGVFPHAVIAGRSITVVDLEHNRARRLRVRSSTGVPPWIVPRSALTDCGFRPCRDTATRGIEGEIYRGLGHPGFVYHDPAHGRVDFKSGEGMTGYGITRSLGIGEETDRPWSMLADRYPFELVAKAQLTAYDLQTDLDAKVISSTTARLRRRYAV